MKTSWAVLFCVLLLVLTNSFAWAVPIWPRALEKAEREGILSEAVLAAPPPWVNSPGPIPAQGHSGNYQVLLIVIEFSDVSNVFSRASFDSMAFTGWPTGSINDYYTEISYGNLTLSGEVWGWYTAGQTRAYYGDNQKGWGTYPKNAAKLVEEAVDAAEVAGCDFSKFDNDGDGQAESIIIVHCGEGSETSLDVNDIQSHVSTITNMGGTARTYDGVTINRYACCPELQSSSPNTHINIGVYCHEYGHILGLPDLYDVGRWCTAYSSWGIGAWGLMSFGGWGGDVVSPQSPSHMCAWSKIKMGWITPTVLSGSYGQVLISAIESNSQVYKIGMNCRETQYFLVSYRDSSVGFDKSLPKRGMLIYHVDDDMYTENDCENGGSCTSGGFNYMVAVEQPDANFNLDCGTAYNYGDRGDMYPYAGIDSFTVSTTPNSNTYQGTSSGVSITNIGWSGSQMRMGVVTGDLYTEIAYDDGYYNQCWSYGDGGGFAVKMTPPAYPALDKGLLIMGCNSNSPNFQCQIWDDSGTGGTPGSSLSGVHTTSGAVAYNWAYEDFTADSIIVSSGDFWALYIQYNGSMLLADNDSPWSGRTMTYWAGTFSADGGAYGNYMIRAVVDTLYCAGIGPNTVPEIVTSVGPNPFTESATIRFSISRGAAVSISVYDVSGRLVRNLAQRPFEAGPHSIVWDGRDSGGKAVGAGIYFYRFSSAGFAQTGKMSLLR
jgi:immune inhibitor A